MPLNGNTFTRLYSWVANAALSIKIRADLMDADSNDIAGGISAVAATVSALAATVGGISSGYAAAAGSTLIGYIDSAAGAVARTVGDRLSDEPTAFNFMTGAQKADVKAGTLMLDVAPALNLFFAAYPGGLLPAGKYRCNSTVTIDGKFGLVLRGEGSAAVAAGTTYTPNTTLVFDNAGAGNDGLVISNFVGLTMEDIAISMNRGGAGGGKALRVWGGHGAMLRNVVVNSDAGTAAVGISLGNGSGATCVFASTLISCKSITTAGGIAFESNVSNTSLNFLSCYAVHGCWSINTLVYSTFSACAADGVTGFAYQFSNCSGLTLNACGGESNTMGVFEMAGCEGMVFNSPFGTSNNTSATPNIGDLIHFNSTSLGNSSITVISPSSVAPNAATTAGIYGTSGTGTVHALNASLSYLIKGFGGDATWLANGLSITGDAENIAFTPTLGSGWSNTGGAPTVAGIYNKKGKLITFTITITPVTTVTGGVAAQISLPWPVSNTTSADVISNTTAFSAAPVTGAKIFLSQGTGALAQPLTISGTILLS